MDLRIANKTALVTGGASGIGKAIVKELLINNVKVYFTSRSKEKIEKFLKEIDLYCNNAQGIVADISQEGEAERIFDEINKSDNIDILVNNVGDTLGILDPYCSLKEWHKLFDLIMGVAIRLNNLSIPIMSKPCCEKYRTASEPTKPAEPVINAIAIVFPYFAANIGFSCGL